MKNGTAFNEGYHIVNVQGVYLFLKFSDHSVAWEEEETLNLTISFATDFQSWCKMIWIKWSLIERTTAFVVGLTF